MFYLSFTLSGESNTIHLKVSPCVTDLPMIEEQDVPILLPDHSGPNLHHWDLTTQQVCCVDPSHPTFQNQQTTI